MGYNVHEGHRQRLKDRYIKSGLDSFEDHNVLELILCYALPRVDTNPIAHNLIKEFGSLSKVLDAPYELLVNVTGVGPNAAAFITLMPDLCRRYLISRGTELENLDPVNTTKKMVDFIQRRLVGVHNEVFFLALFDNKRKPIFCDQIFEGSVNVTNINIRKIVELVVKYNASAAIVAHNHPDGLALPSPEDLNMTIHLRSVLNNINVPLLDHIIVADNESISMLESGYIDKMKRS